MNRELTVVEEKPCEGCMEEVDAFTLLRTDMARVMAKQRQIDATLFRIETAVCLGIILLLVKGNVRGVA